MWHRTARDRWYLALIFDNKGHKVQVYSNCYWLIYCNPLCNPSWEPNCVALDGLVVGVTGLLFFTDELVWWFCCLSTTSRCISWVLAITGPEHCWSSYSITLRSEPKPCLKRQWYLPLISSFSFYYLWHNWQILFLDVCVRSRLPQSLSDLKMSVAARSHYAAHRIDVCPYKRAFMSI